jgi:hypothetical protein
MNVQSKLKGMALATVLLFSAGNYTIAQPSEVDKEAEKILNHYVAAIGGEDALSKIENVVSISEMIIVEAGITINREMIQDKANKLYIKAYSSQTAELLRGYDGLTFWEKNKISVREINDESRLNYLNEFAFMRFARWKENLVDFEYKGLALIDGSEFHSIDISTIYGVKETWYFSPTDYLLSYTKEQLEMTNGVVTVLTKFEDYRTVDGVKHSFTQSIKMGDRNRKINHSSILHNQVSDQKIFAKPSN